MKQNKKTNEEERKIHHRAKELKTILDQDTEMRKSALKQGIEMPEDNNQLEIKQKMESELYELNEHITRMQIKKEAHMKRKDKIQMF